MSRPVRLVAFAGSARRDSFNKKLVAIAARGALAAGAEVTVVDLADYPMPILDQDLEARDGVPEQALRLKKLMMASDGYLISSPEYNSSVTPLLKNTIDWVSRPSEGDKGELKAFRGKSAILMAASPGALGGLRGLVHLRAILLNIGVHVHPSQFALSRANEAFDANGDIADATTCDKVQALGSTLTQFTSKLIVVD